MSADRATAALLAGRSAPCDKSPPGTSARKRRCGVGADLLLGDGGADRLIGGSALDPFGDTLRGGGGDDLLLANTDVGAAAPASFLHGNLGDDSITGDAGDNLLPGQAGDDTPTDHEGDDTLRGGAGDDVVSGDLEDGDDRMVAGPGADRIVGGGGGEDRVILGADGARDVLGYQFVDPPPPGEPASSASSPAST